MIAKEKPGQRAEKNHSSSTWGHVWEGEHLWQRDKAAEDLHQQEVKAYVVNPSMPFWESPGKHALLTNNFYKWTLSGDAEKW